MPRWVPCCVKHLQPDNSLLNLVLVWVGIQFPLDRFFAFFVHNSLCCCVELNFYRTRTVTFWSLNSLRNVYSLKSKSKIVEQYILKNQHPRPRDCLTLKLSRSDY